MVWILIDSMTSMNIWLSCSLPGLIKMLKGKPFHTHGHMDFNLTPFLPLWPLNSTNRPPFLNRLECYPPKQQSRRACPLGRRILRAPIEFDPIRRLRIIVLTSSKWLYMTRSNEVHHAIDIRSLRQIESRWSFSYRLLASGRPSVEAANEILWISTENCSALRTSCYAFQGSCS